jgi:hypothetical protein
MKGRLKNRFGVFSPGAIAEKEASQRCDQVREALRAISKRGANGQSRLPAIRRRPPLRVLKTLSA